MYKMITKNFYRYKTKKIYIDLQNLIIIIELWIKGRKTYLVFMRNVEKGMPQASIMEPILVIPYINDITLQLKTHEIIILICRLAPNQQHLEPK